MYWDVRKIDNNLTFSGCIIQTTVTLRLQLHSGVVYLRAAPLGVLPYGMCCCNKARYRATDGRINYD